MKIMEAKHSTGMQQKIEGGFLFIKTDDKKENLDLKHIKLMSQDKETGIWSGEVSYTLLMRVKERFGLVKPAQDMLDKLIQIQEAVNKERLKPDSKMKALYDYPVKAELLIHQKRAANMALMVFGVIDANGKLRREEIDDQD